MSIEASFADARERKSHIFERQNEDWYVEPAWVWHRLFERLRFPEDSAVYDPACGMGTCVEAACEAGLRGFGTDIVPRWLSRPARRGAYTAGDYADGMATLMQGAIVSNPPFKLAREFAERAIAASTLVCLLLPSKWAQGDARARWLATTPLSDILYLCPRPSMPPGEVILAGTPPGNGTTDFAIFVWTRGHVGAARVGWLHRDGVKA